jgi:predicted TIM-barrel fold metal-dependent hydrolase
MSARRRAGVAVPEGMIMGNLDYQAIDVDNHYYEPLDAFTRYLDKKFRRRGVQMVSDGKHTQAIIGDRVNRFIPNPTFDPIIVPGCLDLLFRGEIPEGVDPASLMKVEELELRPEYQNRDARVAVLDNQDIETIVMFPTFGCGVEEALKTDIDATMASLHAFNLWLDEDWGFDRPDRRVIAAPMISLADPQKAVEEVEFVLERGAKVVHVRPAPVPGVPKPRSLGHRDHDPVWARVAEANVPVAFHLGDSGYLKIAGMWGGKDTFEAFSAPDPLDKIVVDDRAIHDTVASLIVHGVFDRHPKLRVASIENGSEWVHRLVKRLKKVSNQQPRWFPSDPVDTLREHVWVSPYYEEDLAHLAAKIGDERIVFGSDWPHGEGLESPLAFTGELTGFGEAQVHRIMRDNALELLGLKVATAV